mgnify:CR=1 FL=1
MAEVTGKRINEKKEGLLYHSAQWFRHCLRDQVVE